MFNQIQKARCKIAKIHSKLLVVCPPYKKWHSFRFAKAVHVGVLFLGVLLAMAGVLGYAKGTLSPSVNMEKLFYFTNAAREEANLSDLQLDPILSQIADQKSQDMIARGYFGHLDPDGQNVWQKVNNSGYKYLEVGENLAKNIDSEEEIVRAWLDSAEHRENLLNSEFKDVGIGVAKGDFQGSETTLVVEIYGAKE